MELYVVNIYRHGEAHPDELVGMIRKSGSRERQLFSNVDELWVLLTGTGKKIRAALLNDDIEAV